MCVPTLKVSNLVLVFWIVSQPKASEHHCGGSRLILYSTRGRIDIANFNSRYALQLLTPAFIVASLSGRKEIILEDIGELTELFLDAKTSGTKIGSDGDLR
jgi:hypothetical protein